MSLQWLNRYCDQESTRDRSQRPFQLAGHRCATDEYSLIAVRNNGRDDNPGSGRVLDLIRGMLREEPLPPVMTTTLADLWLWLDRLERDVCPCTEYFRDYPGPLPHCPACNGDGWVLPAYDRPWANTQTPDPSAAYRKICPVGTFFGLPVDLNRLLWWLPADLEDVEPDRSVRIWVSAWGRGPAVTFAGKSWRVVQASMSREIYTDQYREYVPGAGQWWHQRRDPVAVAISRDWCEENGHDYAAVWRS